MSVKTIVNEKLRREDAEYRSFTVETRAVKNGEKEELYVEVAVAGTLTFQWSQNTSNATAITASTASRMWVVNVA